MKITRTAVPLIVLLALAASLFTGCDNTDTPAETAGQTVEPTATPGLGDEELLEMLEASNTLISELSNLDYDIDITVRLGMEEEDSTVYISQRARYNGRFGEDCSAHLSSKTSTSYMGDYTYDFYYKNAVAYSNGPYGKYKSNMTADEFYDYFTGETSEYEDIYGGVDSLKAEEADGLVTITYSGAGGSMYDYFVDVLGESSVETDSSTFEFTGKSVIDTADGMAVSEEYTFKCLAVTGGMEVDIDMTMSMVINSKGKALSFIVPDGDASYIELDDISIPDLLFGSLDTLAYTNQIHAVITEDHSFLNSGNLTEYTDTLDLKMAYGDFLEFSIYSSGFSGSDTWEVNEYYDGLTYIYDYNGSASPTEEYTEDDLLSYVMGYYLEYYVSPDYVSGLTMTETENEYIIEFDYSEEYTDYMADYYHYRFFDNDQLTYYAESSEYIRSRGIITVDKQTQQLISQEVFLNVKYIVDGSSINIDAHYLMEIIALSDVTPDSPQSYNQQV